MSWRSAAAAILAGVWITVLPACTFFAGKPPLPKRASIEQGSRPTATTDYAALVANADVIYFPRERAASGARSEPAALVLEAIMQQSAPFAVAWDLVDLPQQPLLAELPGKTENAREKIVRELELSGTGRAREFTRASLRDRRVAELRHLALAPPSAMIARLQSGEMLSADEKKLLATDFSLPPRGWEAYAERNTGRLNPNEMRAAYRAQVVRQQFAAGMIVQFFRTSPPDAKLLVFLRGEDLLAGEGVPSYVAQKIQMRQLVLDSPSASSPAKLLTDAGGWRAPEIVDRAPGPAHD